MKIIHPHILKIALFLTIVLSGETYGQNITYIELHVGEFNWYANTPIRYENLSKKKRPLNEGRNMIIIDDEKKLTNINQELNRLPQTDRYFFEDLRWVGRIIYDNASEKEFWINSKGIMKFEDSTYLVSKYFLRLFIEFLPNRYKKDLEFFINRFVLNAYAQSDTMYVDFFIDNERIILDEYAKLTIETNEQKYPIKLNQGFVLIPHELISAREITLYFEADEYQLSFKSVAGQHLKNRIGFNVDSYPFESGNLKGIRKKKRLDYLYYYTMSLNVNDEIGFSYAKEGIMYPVLQTKIKARYKY